MGYGTGTRLPDTPATSHDDYTLLKQVPVAELYCCPSQLDNQRVDTDIPQPDRGQVRGSRESQSVNPFTCLAEKMLNDKKKKKKNALRETVVT